MSIRFCCLCVTTTSLWYRLKYYAAFDIIFFARNLIFPNLQFLYSCEVITITLKNAIFVNLSSFILFYGIMLPFCNGVLSNLNL